VRHCKPFIFVITSGPSAREGSAFSTFSEACSAVPRTTGIYIVRTLMYIHLWIQMSTTARPDRLRAENINLRVSRSQKALIDRAATALGRNRSDFMLETACREAESVLLDRRYFNLPEDEFRRFTAMLDKPPANNPGLARLLRSKAPWDK
jgi:uncharacterized protein (DUF1778 family)